MAQVIVDGVSFESPQGPRESFDVTVSAQMLEANPPGGGASACGGSGDWAVNLRLILTDGNEQVWAETKQVCVPPEVGETWSGDKQATFSPSIDVGEYNVIGKAQVAHEGDFGANARTHPVDASNPMPLSVVEAAGSPGGPAPDQPSAPTAPDGSDGSSGSDSGLLDPFGTKWDFNFGALAFVVGVLALFWIFDEVI